MRWKLRPRIFPVFELCAIRRSILRAFFESRGRSFPESNSKQAWVLPSGEALENPVGTAPGWFVRIPQGEFAGKIITALPGPPREMTRMWRDP